MAQESFPERRSFADRYLPPGGLDALVDGGNYGYDPNRTAQMYGLALLQLMMRGNQAPPMQPRSVPPQPRAKTGSAFFINNTGLIATNYHVVAGTTVQAIFDHQRQSLVLAQIIYANTFNDLALLQTNVYSKAIPLAITASPKRGDEVLTLGYPSPEIQGVQQKAAFGRINATTGFSDDARFFQVDLPVQPGNSGGPLLNTKGEVIGIVTARLQGDYQNVNYAVKVACLHQLLKEANIKIPYREIQPKPMPMDQIIQRFERSAVLIIAGH